MKKLPPLKRFQTLTQDQRNQIVAWLEEGKSYRWIIKQTAKPLDRRLGPTNLGIPEALRTNQNTVGTSASGATGSMPSWPVRLAHAHFAPHVPPLARPAQTFHRTVPHCSA